MVSKVRARSRHSPDYLVIFLTFLLVVIGLVMLASASSHLSKRQFNDSYYHLKHQALYGLSVGTAGFLLGSFLYYGLYRKIAVPLLLLAILGMVLVFTPLGVASGGAERWLRLGSITFQPAEVLKIPFIIYLAAWLGGNNERQRHPWRGFLPFLCILALVLFLLLRQPATSTAAVLLAVALSVYFISGARLSYIFSALVAVSLILAVVIYVTPYRWARVKAFFNPAADSQTTGYHVNQSTMAIGLGGWLGVGYGQSTTKIKYLPEPIGDSIFAIIAEEMGFVGASGVIAVFVALVIRMLLIAARARDRFAYLMLVGFAMLITLQAFVNIGAISGLLPLTGMPLPFISYGGTALAVFMTMMGIVVNVSKYG